LPAAEPAIDVSSIADRLAAAVREAGAFALQKFRSPLKSWTKGAGTSPVSEVDIAVDEMLHARLTPVDPAIAWLSEESVDDPARLHAPCVWVVDPIDGTRAFLAGRSDWAIAASLVCRGRPVAAAIFAPVDDVLFRAVAGKGATVNGRAVSVSDGDRLEGARAAGPKRYLDALAAAEPRVEALPKVHSLALRLARVAAGTLDVAFAGENSHDWDVVASDLVVHEAGGALTTINGFPLTYNCPNPVHGALVAAGRVRHEIVLQLMRGRQAVIA
jgi:myo-inositol-1(or 4)-monophosphatase